jgi:hypothetical protein
LKSLIIKPGLHLLSSPVRPTLMKCLCFEVKTLTWKKA